MSEIVQTTSTQIQTIIRKQFLNPKLFRYVKLDELTLRVNHGRRNVDITYDLNADSYKVTVHQLKRDLTSTSTTTEGVYVENLANFIK